MHAALRLTLVSPSLGAGGAERVVEGLAAGFIEAGHDVTVVTTTSRPDFYELHPRAQRVALDLSGGAPGSGVSSRRFAANLLAVPAMLGRLGDAIDATTPDLVISFMEDVNVLTLLAAGGRHRVVVTEHNSPRHHPTPRLWRFLRRVTYRRAACLVSVSAGVDREFGWVPAARRRVVNNPLPDASGGLGEAPLAVSTPFVAAMGRLSHQKGFDLLIRAFELVAPRHPDWSLAIIGEGPERPELEALVSDLGLSGRVHLPGQRRDVLTDLASAEVFALSSRWEGFGNVVAEALSVGLPVVSFDCESGPGEIIQDGRTGVLVPPRDVTALAGALDAVIADGEGRSRMARHAPASVAHLRRERVIDSWHRQVFPLVRGDAGDAVPDPVGMP